LLYSISVQRSKFLHITPTLLHIRCDLTDTVPSTSPLINLHPTDIHSDYPTDDEEDETDTTSIALVVEDRNDTTSIPLADVEKDDTTLISHSADKKVDATSTSIPPAVDKRIVTTLISPAIDEKIDTTAIPPAVDEKGDTTSIPHGIYSIVAVGGIIAVVLLGCLAAKKQKKKSTKKAHRGILASSSQCDMDEDSCASPVSVQESHDVNSNRTGSLEEVSLEDDDVERGNSTLISDISSSRECEDTTPTEKKLGTLSPLRSVFPAGSIASILNMAGIAYLNRVDIKAILKSPSEKAVAPWQSFDANDSWSWESQGSVSENNTEQGNIGTPGPPHSLFSVGTVTSILKVHVKSIRKSRSEDAAAPWQLFDANDSSPQESHGSVSEYNASNDDMSSSTSSVYIEDSGINDSDSDGSSISSHRDWKDAHQSMDNTIVWSFSATHNVETCEMSEI
jgi:hypothetical protein